MTGLNNILDKMQEFFSNPKKAFASEKKTNISEAIRYSLFGLVIVSMLSVILALVLSPEVGNELALSIGLPLSFPLIFVVLLALQYLSGIASLLIYGVWLHIFVYAFGARKGIRQTIKSVLYGATPTYYLGWLPFIGLVASIWSFVLYGFGLKELQGLSTGKAAGAIIISALIPMVIGAIVLMMLINAIPASELASAGFDFGLPTQ